ncbi:MAG: undecaprenyl/decaprenyl-phosphate alpha-N-acetylglucosaminyl 1-phosphate transferase [Anaerolineae bacterium]|nr:undecaprenyl/decaprenyl-phosphate alpha-N-acetylglucosaminyl 1-phosphate transferase [Anaerolineae bacterium]
MWLAYAVTFAVAFGIAFALSPLCARLGLRLGMADHPGGRRRHGRVVSRLGGIALYLGFVGAVLLSQTLNVPRFDVNEPRRLAGLLIGTTIVCVLGLVDDRYELAPGPQYIVQALATAVGMVGLIFIEYVNNPFSSDPNSRLDFPWWLTIGVTFFWMMGMMQTVNWLDGLDGLAAGVTAIAAVVLFIHSGFRLNPPQESVSLLPLALAGACLGFLPFNFAPARVFMGGGAYTLGYALGALAIIGGAKVATVLLVMGIPILDVAFLIVWRRLKGRRADMGDRHHLHFRLHDMGLSQRTVVLGYYAFSAAFGTLALVVPPRQYKLLALAVLGLVALAIFAFTGRRTATIQ